MRNPRLNRIIIVLFVALTLLETHYFTASDKDVEIVAPPEHRRGADQTFLTFPEWFLVFSPAEYAEYVATNFPSNFPFVEHIEQLWTSYAAVTRATFDLKEPINWGYHLMIMVIGCSTTLEYSIRFVYESIIGRLTEALTSNGLSEEDIYAAKVAKDYVNVILDVPWYEYDFWEKLVGLWYETKLYGPDLIRKWERKYALTTEYLSKAIYGKIIKKLTKIIYEDPLPVTAVLLNNWQDANIDSLPDLKILSKMPDMAVLAIIPRYDKFKNYAQELADLGVEFIEIAGNKEPLLFSAIMPVTWVNSFATTSVLFEQPILTQPARKRVVLVTAANRLALDLKTIKKEGGIIEHVFDY